MTYRWRVTLATRYAVQLPAAILAGLALWLAFPDHDLWFLAPVAVALLAWATLRAGGRRGFVLGLVAGWAFFIPVLSWSGTYVGMVPWFALATLQGLYFGVMGAVAGSLGRRQVDADRLGLALTVVPLTWVVQEWARSTTPFGGFPWARLAFSQADGPLLPLARLGGAPGLAFAVALIGTGLVAVVLGLRARRGLVLGGVVALALPVAVAALPATGPITLGVTASIGLVQGNVPQAGLEFNAQRRAVLDNHVRGTEELAADGGKDLSLVVWPENASDIDPVRNADAAAAIQRAVTAVDTPVLVGGVLNEPVGHNSNVSLLYRPGGAEPERYTKLHPVPFAEYIPYRSFFRLFSPAADLAGNFVAGDTIGAFDVVGPTGTYVALPTICFEVAYDGLLRDSVNAAGSVPSVLIVQTNNATFGYTAESEQQFAISRIRAVEHGRSVVHVSTVGVSGFIAPDGSVTGKTGLFTHEYRTHEVEVRTGTTPAHRFGAWVEPIATLGLLLLALGSVRAARSVRVVAPAPRPTKESLSV